MSGSNSNLHVDTLPFRYDNEGRNIAGPVCTLAAGKNSGWFQISPGYASLFVAGVFGGATVKFQLSPNYKAKNVYDLWTKTAKDFTTGQRIGPCWGRWEVAGGDVTTLIECYFTIGG